MRTALIIIVAAMLCAIICGTIAYYSPEASAQRELKRRLELNAMVWKGIFKDPSKRKVIDDFLDSSAELETRLGDHDKADESARLKARIDAYGSEK
jgi:hypothetical protein